LVPVPAVFCRLGGWVPVAQVGGGEALSCLAAFERNGDAMPHKGRDPGPELWLRLVAAGLAAAASVATAASASGNDASVTAGGPSGCVVLRVSP